MLLYTESFRMDNPNPKENFMIDSTSKAPIESTERQPLKKILIVEDDIDILLLLTIFLKENGYEVEGTLNGIEASRRISRFKPDLIVMDIFLSGTNGRDICMSLKNSDETRAIPIILISSDEQDKAELEIIKADEFINKPFQINYLLSKIKEHLDQRMAA